MSDKQKGLVEAIGKLMPDAEHRFCVMHLYSNFKLSHRRLQFKEILWKAASTTRIVDFKDAMDELKKTDTKAFNWLASRSPQHWCKAYFSTFSKCDMLFNNLCESFNGMILKARFKPIITMLELIRHRLMKRIHQQRDLLLKNNSRSILCPKIKEMLDELKKNAMLYDVKWKGHEQFEVIGSFREKFIVQLGKRTCSCRKWDVSGIQCKHAIAGMFYMHYQVEEFVVDHYKNETYLKSYNHLMNPIHGHEEWPQTDKPLLHPPLIEKMPRRPKKNRKKHPSEVIKENGKKKLIRRGTQNKCSICKVTGH